MRLTQPEDYYIKVLLNKTPIKGIMTSPVKSVFSEDPFRKVVELFEYNHIRHLPVVDPSNHVVGLISQRDLYRIQPPRKMENGNWFYDNEMLDMIILKDAMTPNPFTLHPEDPVARAVTTMVQFRYGCIPIVDQQAVLCGIITQFDILKIAMEILQEGTKGH